MKEDEEIILEPTIVTAGQLALLEEIAGMKENSETVSFEMTFERGTDDLSLNRTVPGSAQLIMRLHPEIKQHEHRISAIIKRLVHEEKNGLLERLYQYLEAGQSPESFLKDLRERADKHAEWFNKSDEEIVTWKTGTL